MGTEDQETKASGAELPRLKARVKDLEAMKAKEAQARQALFESEQRYRSVFENTGTATIIIEHDMTISMGNAKFVELTGYSKPEIEGKMKWTAFVVPDDRDRMAEYHRKRRIDRLSAPTEYECRVFDRKGEIKHMFVRIDMIPDTLQSVASFMDITAFKQTESALIESERKLSKLMGNLPGMAYRCRHDDFRTMNYVSAGCKWLTGYAPYDLIDNASRAYTDLIHPEDIDRVRQRIGAALSANRPFQMEYRIVSASGEIKWVWEEGLGIFADGGEAIEFEGFISDITGHKLEEQQLRRENITLKSNIKERYKFGAIIGKNRAMQEVYERISKAAAGRANVIIYGESGTGKELVAREIHRISDTGDLPFIPVNCSAIPENLFESEFFGHRKGAFTGAVNDKSGYFDRADGGTLFLDELGEIGISVQAKLLRVLEGGGYTPVGGNEVKNVSVRILAATSRDLKAEVKKGRMREDFFYRIHIIPITMPPLRERKDDLPLLIEHFLTLYSKSDHVPDVDGKLLGRLYNYDWPGNVRELQNVLQRYITLNTLDFLSTDISGSVQSQQDFAPEPEGLLEGPLDAAMDQCEKRIIRHALEKSQWKKNDTADHLKINRKTLFRKMKKHGLD